jgi:dTDP-4-dehydrorhamnose 3,5-epimerase-like enzyme
MTDPFWEGLVTPVDCPSHADGRGVLTPIAFAEHGFAVVRAFVVTAPDGSLRGGHGHRQCRQLLMRVRGEIRIDLAHAGRHARVVLGETVPGLLVEPGVWSRQAYLGDDAAMVVFCDTEFDPDDYFTDPGDAR